MRVFTKLELAETQLGRAISLYLDCQDYVSALTLAGAAEEILGKMVERAGGSSALREYCESFDDIKRYASVDLCSSQFKKDLNCYRNELKHDDGVVEVVVITPEVAAEMIDRAIKNYEKLISEFSSDVQRYLSER